MGQSLVHLSLLYSRSYENGKEEAHPEEEEGHKEEGHQEEDVSEVLMKKELEEILSELHESVAHEFLNRIKAGGASAAELTAAIKFLKDNGIDANLTQESPLVDLSKILPFQDPDSPIKSEVM